MITVTANVAPRLIAWCCHLVDLLAKRNRLSPVKFVVIRYVAAPGGERGLFVSSSIHLFIYLFILIGLCDNRTNLARAF